MERPCREYSIRISQVVYICNNTNFCEDKISFAAKNYCGRQFENRGKNSPEQPLKTEDAKIKKET